MNLTGEIGSNLEQKKVSVCVSLDVEKAFDTLWTNAIIFKMIMLNFPSKLILFINSYLRGRSFQVAVGKAKSPIHEIVAGVPQGSILGPILFILTLHDIPKFQFTKLNMFADDTSLTASSSHASVAFARAQSHLDALFHYFTKWKVKVNEAKTTFTVFTSRRSIPDTLSLSYGGIDISQSRVVKLLGIHLDGRLRFKRHVDEVMKKSRDAFAALRPLLKARSGLSTLNKLALYRIFVRSTLTYGIVVWNSISSTNMNRVQVVQNKALRHILNLFPDPFTFRQISNQRVHAMSGLETITNFMKRLTLKCYEKMTDHANGLVRGLADPTLMRHNKRSFLYAIREHF